MKFRFRRSGDTLENYAKRIEERIHELMKELQKKNEHIAELQAQLIQSEKMTAIGQLGAGVAHELNNPLAGILGYAQFALEKLSSAGHSAADLKKLAIYLEYIEREATRCKGIVENLLVFARKANEFRIVDLKEVLRDSLVMMKHQLTLANVNASLDMPGGEAKVRGNAAQLQQVFINIILNAQQAISGGGGLKVALRQADDKFEVNFEDSGCGIPNENLDKIFQPFFTTKKDTKGMGLGLTVSSLIIKEHKGSISVRSEPGKGSTFTVALPGT